MLITLIIVALAIVIVLGLLIFFLMRRSQKVVPDVADGPTRHRDLAVSVDEEGRTVTESQEAPEPPRDDAAFEAVLKEELEDLGR